MSTAKQTALNIEAMELFGVKSEKMIQTALYALGFRQPCGRCGGSGSYSYCQMYGDRCFGCQGKKFVAMKLTRKLLDEAKVKVDAGELIRIREVGALKIAARKSIAGLVEVARAVYVTISAAYNVEYKRVRNLRGVYVSKDIFNAQHMNNSLFWDCIRGIEHNVELGSRKDYERCAQEIQEATNLLVQLRDAWLAFDANKEVSMEDAEREIYGALLADLTAHDRMIDAQHA